MIYRFRSLVLAFIVLLGLSLMAPTNAMANSDEDKIIKRVQPVLSPMAHRSGYCCSVFDIKDDGTTTNIKSRCNEPYFRKSTIQSIEQWEYNKRAKNSKKTKRTGYRNLMKFLIRDREGNIALSRNGFPSPIKERNTKDYLCRSEIFM